MVVTGSSGLSCATAKQLNPMPSPRHRRPHISESIRRQVAQQAQHRCGYCLTAQEFTAMPMEIEHIIPLIAGGNSNISNLWLACPFCNGYKATQTHARDFVTGMPVPLFHPRQQRWQDHFSWSADGTEIIGQTPTGRATVLALKLNNEHLTRARRRWVMAGWHPPLA